MTIGDIELRIAQALGFGEVPISDWDATQIAAYYNLRDQAFLETENQAEVNGFDLLGEKISNGENVINGREIERITPRIYRRLADLRQTTQIPWGEHSQRFMEEVKAIRREVRSGGTIEAR